MRSVTPVTRVPRLAVRVWAASHASVVQASGRSSQGRPTWGICNRWSITQMLEKPTASAVAAISANHGASAVPAG